METKTYILILKKKKNWLHFFEKSNVLKTAFTKEHDIPGTTLNNILLPKKVIEDY